MLYDIFKNCIITAIRSYYNYVDNVIGKSENVYRSCNIFDTNMYIFQRSSKYLKA